MIPHHMHLDGVVFNLFANISAYPATKTSHPIEPEILGAA